MRTRISKPFLTALAFAWLAGDLAPQAAAQTPLSLQLNLIDGYPTLAVTGPVGTIYSIQTALALSPAGPWTDRALLQLHTGDNLWTDPAAPMAQQFYRAISLPPPADTNLVFIAPGTFLMGSPTNEALRNPDEGQHPVTLSSGFWIAKYLVTQQDYLAVVGRNPSFFSPAYGYTEDLSRPVEQVSWMDATNYCALRTQLDRAAGLIPANAHYRLPTEAEWEYACRAGSATAFYLGNTLRSGQANFDGQWEYDAALGGIYNPLGALLFATTPVGRYAPNSWHLFDMIGNVAEWCQDRYGAYPTNSVTDPAGATSGSTRVLRGGSCYSLAVGCRSAQRLASAPAVASRRDFGFRVVLTPN
jgi:formylglycine-generating enzyme required for sulfatase activity